MQTPNPMPADPGDSAEPIEPVQEPTPSPDEQGEPPTDVPAVE